MSSAHTAEVRQLYRAFWRLYRRWPAEERRSKSFRQYWMTRVRNSFVDNKGVTDPERIRELVAGGRQELDSLASILEGSIEKEIPLAKDGPILSNMPNPERYQLLDVDMKDAIREKNQLRFLIEEFQSKRK
ncbi:hypothetical protein DFJ74DRAFT_617129 [Hyaloraphidium curvatum]|nr:hypothetical protein DFJ74DRAFT_617129 [Hyaloraphidium curvatum]